MTFRRGTHQKTCPYAPFWLDEAFARGERAEIAEVRGIPADVAKAVHEALVAWNAERAEAAAKQSEN